MPNIPADLLYTPEHEYVRDVVEIGITDYAQGELGDVVFVELPKPGTTFERMGVFGTVEAVKAVSELFCPLSGEVVEATLRPGADIAYDQPPVPGLEQHLWVHTGALEVTANGQTYQLLAGDCLRFRLWGPSRFRCLDDQPVRYGLLVVLP